MATFSELQAYINAGPHQGANCLVLAAREADMVKVLALMKRNLDLAMRSAVDDSAQGDGATSVEALFAAVKDPIEEHFSNALAVDSLRGLKDDRARIRLDAVNSVWVLVMEHLTLAMDTGDLSQFLCVLSPGDYGIAHLYACDDDGFASVHATSLLHHGGAEFTGTTLPWDGVVLRAGTFSSDSLRAERDRLAGASNAPDAGLDEIADIAALRAWPRYDAPAPVWGDAISLGKVGTVGGDDVPGWPCYDVVDDGDGHRVIVLRKPVDARPYAPEGGRPFWTKENVSRLYDAVKAGSVEQLRNLIVREGAAASLPLRFKPDLDERMFRYEGGYSPLLLWDACVWSHDAETLRFLLSAGFSFDDLDLFDRLWRDDKVAYFDHGDDVFWWHALKRRCEIETHIQKSPATGEMVPIREYLDEDNRRWLEFLDAALNAGYHARVYQNAYGTKGLRKSRMDSLNELVYTHLPEDINLVERLMDAGFPMAVRSLRHEVWEELLRQERCDTIEFFARNEMELPGPSARAGYHAVRPGTPVEAIDRMRAAGMPIELVYTECDRELLLACAARGMKPVRAGWQHRQWLRLDAEARDCLRDLCLREDAELVRAFLEGGLVVDLDAGEIRKAGHGDMADLLVSYGYSEHRWVGPDYRTEAIEDGRDFFDDEGYACVPPGTVRVCRNAFDAKHVPARVETPRGLRPLPDSLRIINEGAFSGVLATPMWWNRSSTKKVRSVVEVPRSVEWFGAGSFYGFDKIIVYDSIDGNRGIVDEEVLRRAQRQDLDALKRISSIGLACTLGSLDDNRGTTRIHPFEMEVRSAQTGEVRYRVWMPVDDSKRPRELVYVWGKGASVYFPGIDIAFDGIRHAMNKVGIATLRLRWPEQLTDEVRAKYEKFVAAGAKAKQAANILIADDDVDGLALFEPLGILRKTNIGELIECAETGLPRMGWPFGGADYNALEHDGDGDARPACAAYLREYRDAHFGKRASKRKK